MITLKTGEIREVAFQFLSDDTFIIKSANYIITDNLGVELSTGIAEIDETIIIALFPATEKGEFKVEFTVDIANEIYKPRMTIYVK